MIDFEHVSKQYKHNAKPALEDVNFHVDDGEFVFLLGHSGAGKSTLLKLILREETPTEGRVLVNGQDVARLRRRKIPYLRRQMGIIFQDFRLIPTMTVYENIAFAMHVTNIGHKQIKERVNYMLELVHLEDKAKVYPDLLSGGEQQRVAVARALAHLTSQSGLVAGQDGFVARDLVVDADGSEHVRFDRTFRGLRVIGWHRLERLLASIPDSNDDFGIV